MMRGWELVDGREPDSAIEKIFADQHAAYLTTRAVWWTTVFY
jgi:hypothetical protein